MSIVKGGCDLRFSGRVLEVGVSTKQGYDEWLSEGHFSSLTPGTVPHEIPRRGGTAEGIYWKRVFPNLPVLQDVSAPVGDTLPTSACQLAEMLFTPKTGWAISRHMFHGRNECAVQCTTVQVQSVQSEWWLIIGRG